MKRCKTAVWLSNNESHVGRRAKQKETVMSTGKTVSDGQLSFELEGQMHRRFDEILRRVQEGTLEPYPVLNALQGIVEGKHLGRRWSERDGVIYFSVTSNGMTGEQWITHLEAKGCRIGNNVDKVLRSLDFKPTNGVTTEIAILPGRLFEDNDRITKKIRAEADKRKLTKPNAEVACLIRDMFSNEEIKAMGLWWIVAMHELIKDSDGHPHLLSADRGDDGCCWLYTYYGGPDNTWTHVYGFAFVVSQVGSKRSWADSNEVGP